MRDVTDKFLLAIEIIGISASLFFTIFWSSPFFLFSTISFSIGLVINILNARDNDTKENIE